MTREQFIYALTACGCLLKDGKTWYEHNELIKCFEDLGLFEQEPVLDKIRSEIAAYGSIWVSYAITGRKDSDIERLVKGVLKQAKEQVLDIIDKYKAESEE